MKSLLLTSASLMALIATPALAQNSPMNAQNCSCPQVDASAPLSSDEGGESTVRKEGGYGKLHAETGNKPTAEGIRDQREKDRYARRYQTMMENLNEGDNSKTSSSEAKYGPLWSKLADDGPDSASANQQNEPLWNEIGTAQSDPSNAGPVPGFDDRDSGQKMTTARTAGSFPRDEGPARDAVGPDGDDNLDGAMTAGTQTNQDGQAWSQIGTARKDPSGAGPVPGFDAGDSGKGMTPPENSDFAGLADDKGAEAYREYTKRGVKTNADAAINQARALLPDVNFVRWRIDRENGSLAYEVAGRHKSTGEIYMVDVKPSGRIEEIEQVIPLSRVPRELRRTAGQVVQGMMVERVKRSMRGDMQMFYEFTGKLPDGRDAFLSIRHDGRYMNLRTG